MRKTLTALFIAAALPTFVMAAPAANDLPPPPMEGGHMMGQHGPRHGGPMKELNLTREQRQQMGKLMGEQMKARHEITQRYLDKLPAAEQKALKDELKASHEKTQKDIRALLTPNSRRSSTNFRRSASSARQSGPSSSNGRPTRSPTDVRATATGFSGSGLPSSRNRIS